jgi:phospholipase C
MASDGLSNVEHVVMLMLENRSFDHMLGFLYTDQGNRSDSGQAFDGLTGNESNPGSDGKPVPVQRIQPSTPNAYLLPGADPGEGYYATNAELFGSETAPSPPMAKNDGFVTDFAHALSVEQSNPRWKVVPGTTEASIMWMHTPSSLPVLAGLARGYAVSDRWFAPAPTETMPNRAFALAATSQGHLDDQTKVFTVPSVFSRLTSAGVGWTIYGYSNQPLTRNNFPDTQYAPENHFGVFSDFSKAAAGGTLAAFSFLEPSWGNSGNSQHPVANVAAGEQLIHDVYYALRSGPAWNRTLLIITYDEHGGCYDHVPPPLDATPPDASVGQFGFDFKRFGVRVPAVLVSPLVERGTVYRAPDSGPPLDHTSVLATLEKRFGAASLTARDKVAPLLGDVLTLTAPRTDDPLQGVIVPKGEPSPAAEQPSHMQKIEAQLVATLPVPGERRPVSDTLAPLQSGDDYERFIDQRTRSWIAAGKH